MKHILRSKLNALVFLACLSFSSVYGKITLPEMFTDNMVLQQQSAAPIWGKATPNKKVTILTSWDKQSYATQSDNNGNWKIKVNTPTAGGPYEISISDGKKTDLKNIMIGEVWICSGQSNMELLVAGNNKVVNHEKEVASANYPNIRFLHIERGTASQPQTDLINGAKGGWKVCSPKTVGDFSAVAYFFGRNLNENLNVPIGLISTSWGGTVAEAWTSGESLEYMPDFRESLEEVRKTSGENEDELQAEYERKMQERRDLILAKDEGLKNGNPIWANIPFDDSGWKNMKLPQVWDKQGLSNFDGIVWFRKEVEIPENWSGQDLTIALAMIDDSDITFFNGQKIGETDGYNKERIYTVPKKIIRKGKNIISIRVTDTANEGGVHGEIDNMFLATKLDASTYISLSGEWKYKVSVDFGDLPSIPPFPKNNPNRPSVLYNAMIHPLVPYAIKGAIWYQGESNDNRAYQYRELFPLMIRDWRKQWNSDFPFYFVQLANFREVLPEPTKSYWAELREAQLMTLNLENTGMCVAIDIGEAKDIHPRNKQDVGLRLALNARAKTYGQNISYSGPIYDSYIIEGNKIRIKFKHRDGGLCTRDNDVLKGFEIAGSDHKFYWADAVIENDEIIVSSSQVVFPVAVRYAWADNPECNLYNKEGLPASPFRTDDWR